jgi:hypothetical protein
VDPELDSNPDLKRWKAEEGSVALVSLKILSSGHNREAKISFFKKEFPVPDPTRYFGNFCSCERHRRQVS